MLAVRIEICTHICLRVSYIYIYMTFISPLLYFVCVLLSLSCVIPTSYLVNIYYIHHLNYTTKVTRKES